MRACLAKADCAGLRRARRRVQGARQGARLRLRDLHRMHRLGRGEEGSPSPSTRTAPLTVVIGTQSTGQGHETAYAQFVSEQFDLPLERITRHPGRHRRRCRPATAPAARAPFPIGAVLVDRASTKLAASLKELAADKLEARSPTSRSPTARCASPAPTARSTLADVATLPNASDGEAEGDRGIRAAERDLSERHARLRGRDRPGDRRHRRSSRYTIVDDFGVTVNPLLLAGQVHGGIAQGVGQALDEKAVFDETGQLLTASFMDYSMPRADNFPSFQFETRNVPSTTNPIGLEGRGRGGLDRLAARR